MLWPILVWYSNPFLPINSLNPLPVWKVSKPRCLTICLLLHLPNVGEHHYPLPCEESRGCYAISWGIFICISRKYILSSTPCQQIGGSSQVRDPHSPAECIQMMFFAISMLQK